MLRSILAKTLWDQRRGIVIWSLAIGAVGVLYAAFWPSINNPDMAAALEAYPEGLLEAIGFTDVSSPAGYLGATTYGLLGPVLTIIFAATLGSRAVAGDEESGRLDVLLAHPVERWAIVVQRAAAMVVAIAIAQAVLLAAMLAAAGPADFGSIGTENLAAASLQLGLLGLFFGSLALAVGAVTGSRGAAWGAVALIGILTYFANTLGPSVDAIAWSRDLSPFFYYARGRPLVDGWQIADGLVLLGSAIALLAIAVIGFRRRDVGV